MIIGVALGVLLQVGGATPVIIDRAHLDPKADVNFHAVAVPDTVYVGDAALYELGVFIADEVRQRLRKNPEFVPAELRSVLAYDLRDIGARSIVRDGRTYEVHVFRRALFPVSPGTIVVPPARLSYALPLGSSFFSREETHTLRSEPVTIVAIAPPLAGRPPNWNGAVGDLRISTVVNARSTRVGDPFVVTLRVSGEANVHLLPRPQLAMTWATVVPSAERVMIDTMAHTVRGSKEFDFLVTPSVDGGKLVPAVEYPFFDPSARTYRVARTSPTSITVGEGTLVAVDTTSAATSRRAAMPLRTVWSTSFPDAPDHSLWYLILATLVPLPAIARMVKERPRRRVRSVPEGELHVLAEGAGTPEPAHVRTALQRALNARLGGAAVPWADTTAVRRALRHHGVTKETIDEALQLLSRIDATVFGTERQPIPDVARHALRLYEKIDDEAQGVRISARKLKGAAAGAAMVLFAAALVAQTQLSPRAAFDHAVAAYASGDPAAAASDFFDVAKRAPAVVSAWVNAGTASWQAGDTARAVVGWQRALRLDPLDDNVRDLLTLVGADAGASHRAVWPVPRRIPAWLALILWVGGWITLWRGRRRRAAAFAVGAAVICAAVSQVQHARLTDPRVVVLSSPAQLRSLPAMGAEAGSMPLTGELLTVIERSGLWVRVTGADDRDGWIDAARVLDLNAHPLRD